MKSFRQYISEALNYHQRSYVDQITHGDHLEAFVDTDFSDHVFGGPSSGLGRHDDKDVKIIPFDGTDDLKRIVPLDVSNHLEKIGYQIYDWSKGLVTRKNIPAGSKPRPIGFSKVLESTKNIDRESHYYADQAWKRHSVNIPHLEKGLEIMITRHPYHVAEQSTNKAWRSCLSLGTCPDMNQGFIGDEEVHKELEHKQEAAREQARRLGRANQDPGIHFEKVGGDIRGGAHMAYLIHKGDYNLKNPLARISLKPFHSEDINHKYQEVVNRELETNPMAHLRPTPRMAEISWGRIKPEHTILRPLGMTYKRQEFTALNPLIDMFERQTKRFAETHFPMRNDIHNYHLDPRVQRDKDERTTLFNWDRKR